MAVAWVAAGSNLGARASHLDAARSALAAHPDIRVVASTAPESTAPLGGLRQPEYLNQMHRLETVLPARGLMGALHAIERAEGRVRGERWGSRTLDLDLVRYDDLLCDVADLTLPHPGLRDRPFWAREIAELERRG